MRFKIIALICLGLLGCSAGQGYLEYYDFSQVQKVAIIPFQPDYSFQGMTPEMGEWAADEFFEDVSILRAFNVVGREQVDEAFDQIEETPDPLIKGEKLKRFSEAAGVEFVFRANIRVYRETGSGASLGGGNTGASIKLELVQTANDSVVWRVKEETSSAEPMTNYEFALKYCIVSLINRIKENLAGQTEPEI